MAADDNVRESKDVTIFIVINIFIYSIEIED